MTHLNRNKCHTPSPKISLTPWGICRGFMQKITLSIHELMKSKSQGTALRGNEKFNGKNTFKTRQRISTLDKKRQPFLGLLETVTLVLTMELLCSTCRQPHMCKSVKSTSLCCLRNPNASHFSISLND